MQAKRVQCVLRHQFSLIQLHGFLTALPQPRQCCLGLVIVKTALPTSLGNCINLYDRLRNPSTALSAVVFVELSAQCTAEVPPCSSDAFVQDAS